MKILILLSASLFGFGLVCKDVTNVAKPAVNNQVVPIIVEQPVATIVLDTIEVVYTAPVAIAQR